jgi:hypothetical protein
MDAQMKLREELVRQKEDKLKTAEDQLRAAESELQDQKRSLAYVLYHWFYYRQQATYADMEAGANRPNLLKGKPDCGSRS